MSDLFNEILKCNFRKNSDILKPGNNEGNVMFYIYLEKIGLYIIIKNYIHNLPSISLIVWYTKCPKKKKKC